MSFAIRIRPSLRVLLPALLALVVAACSRPDPLERAEEMPPQELYATAERLLGEESYEKAAKAFEEVERQHPYSEYATRAQLMAAVAHYRGGDYDAAIAAAQRFVELHPGHPDVPYALYLIGESWYEQLESVERDQTAAERALEAFRDLVRRHPDSDWSKDARLKIDLLLDHLAGREMEVGRFYAERGQWLAACNRFQRVVEDYQTTVHVPEALYRLVECYLALGLPEEAKRAASVLGHNYPDSKWYRRAYALVTEGKLPPGERPRGLWSRFADLLPF